MKISYSDIQRGSDYHGTKIIIDFRGSSLDEKLRAHCLLVHLIYTRPYTRNWYYKCVVKKNIIEFWGYDGFLASLIEGELTGDFKSYLGDRGQSRRPRKSIDVGWKAVQRRKSND